MKDKYTISLVKGKRKLFDVYENGNYIGKVRVINHKNGSISTCFLSNYINSLPSHDVSYIQFICHKALGIC